MKIYIAGKLCSENEKKQLEKIAKLCEELGFETFLPHRDAGICESLKDIKKIFKKDILEGMGRVDLVIAMLDGLHVGAGTAWELGYAYAKNIPAIGIKTDESPEDALEYLSAILLGSMQIVKNFEDLEEELKKLI